MTNLQNTKIKRVLQAFLYKEQDTIKSVAIPGFYKKPGIAFSFFLKIILFPLVLCIIFGSCSRKKDKFINRNFHAMGTYYNTVFNGQNALKKGREELVQNYTDNYWDILPIERMEILESSQEKDTNPNFSRAEEKAIKAIQKHSMLFNGEEHNPQINKAFLLLGKARYYNQHFFPALEAFNYILTKYAKVNELVAAKIWQGKTYMRMGNNEQALKNLKALLDTDLDFNDQNYAKANATMAQLYINLGDKDSALAPLKKAIALIHSNKEKGRYLYIKGQLYNHLNETDSADMAFDEVIALHRKTPRVYRINAYMEKARNFDFDKEDRQKLVTLLKELEQDRENRPYLDKIYYQLAQYYKANDSLSAAISYYNQSLRTGTSDQYLRSRNYLTLGNFNFNAADYKEAGAYYDSTLTNLMKNSREYRSIAKKRENLDDVILYEGIANKNDSILHLVAMAPSERETYFTTYTDSLKANAIARAKSDAENLRQDVPPDNLFETQKSQAGNRKTTSGETFYFYNANERAYGKQKFEKIWGKRQLKDNWRIESSNKKGNKDEKEAYDLESLISQIENDSIYDPNHYIAQIPNRKPIIDSLVNTRNFAYYQLGIIYKEKFKEYQLAADKLEALLQNDPENRLILPSKYNLYKIYTLLGNTERTRYWKKDILTKNPNSRYAEIIKNPSGLRNNKNSPNAVYKQVYQQFEDQEYKKVIEETEKNIKRFTGEDIVPKFELLKASAEGRLNGFEAYKKGLNYVALNYPQSTEGKRAEEIISKSLPLLKNDHFSKPGKNEKFKIVYTFSAKDKAKTEKFYQKTKEAITQLKYPELKTSIDIYNPAKTFVVIHGLNSRYNAKNIVNRLQKDKHFKLKHKNFEISSGNYKTLQVHKNLDTYLKSIAN